MIVMFTYCKLGLMYYNRSMLFGNWFENEFIKWRGNTRKTLSDFARWLEMNQSAVSKLINHPERNPSIETLQKLEKKLPAIRNYVFTASPTLSEEVAERIRQTIMESLAECERQSINPTSPQGSKIVSDLLLKHGIKTRSKS
jgi:hypothetical protein